MGSYYKNCAEDMEELFGYKVQIEHVFYMNISCFQDKISYMKSQKNSLHTTLIFQKARTGIFIVDVKS